MSITHAFPVNNTRYDRHYAIEIEQSIQRNMLKKNLILVGWYHSHPRIAAQPTLRDCDAQLEYQIKMLGTSEETYTPCIGLICSPYYSGNPTLESSITAYWIVPPMESRAMEYGRPMAMQFSVTQDKEMSEHVKTEMLISIDYYRQFENEMVKFDAKYGEDATFIEKLKTTLYSKFPREQNDFEFWNWLRQNLGLAPETEFAPPKWTSRDEMQTTSQPEPLIESAMTMGLMPPQPKQESFTISLISDSPEADSKSDIRSDVLEIRSVNDDDQRVEITDGRDFSVHNLTMDNNALKEAKEEKLRIRSLQEQLKLPSGLNMTPSPISTIPMLQPAAKSAVVPLVSPRDSPITIPSSSASPATKIEMQHPPPTPSPAKSDISITRNRNSPMPANVTKYPSYVNTPTSSKQGTLVRFSPLIPMRS